MSTKRQPKGIPVGGQFAANAHDEAGSSLGNDSVVATEEQAQRYSTALGYGHQWMRKESMQAATEIVRKQSEHPDADADEITKLLVRDYEDRDDYAISPEGHRQVRRAVHAVLGQEMKPYRPKRRQDATRGDEFVVLGNTPEKGRSTVAIRYVTPTQITDHLGSRWSIATGKEIGGTRTLVPAEESDGAPE